ncbi:MBL fold metallo-hydrolase [Pseudomaricurvus alkylphenolicus]|jgi:glyoxylase-like metal-dependent hydrolase (beta-lactamase superfamily II)|uniref:MBL fold metallo-hydrolase n=1 Tax=Pseudomaricurvus alkylphenolicus TaxID=1306991 RepID=UPI001F10BBEC|nr:MBL fold metallo-hydrolase [Pseudomaricurvus alkylphenolicus]
MPGNPDHINLWLLEDGDGWTVVDTGMNIPSMRDIWEQLFEGFMKGKPVKRVIVTHLHPDHIGLAGWMTRRFDCRLWISREEYMMCKAMVTDTGKPAPDVAINFYKAAGVGEEVLERYRQRFGHFGEMISPLPDSYRRLKNGETIEINDRYWQVIVGSGHSPEHVLLYCPALKILISGDQILPRETSNVSVMPPEPDSDPLDEWMASCANIREQMPGNVLVLPAHEEPFKGVGVRLTQLIEFHKDKLSQLFNLVDEPKQVVECFPAVFRREISGGATLPAVGETLAHLNSLIQRRMVMRQENPDGVDTYLQLPDACKFE